MSISSELSGALRYCNDIEGERIALPTLYEFWLDSCHTMDADLQLSESWRNVVLSPVFQIAQQEQLLPAAIEGVDPVFEVGLDYRLAGTSDRFRSVQLVAPERVADVESISAWFVQAGYNLRSSSRIAAFYGFPRNIILSFDPTLFEFRMWYVPGTPADRSNRDGPSGLPETYGPLRKVLTAHKALPHCGYDEVTFRRLNDVILRELAIWQPRWDRYKDKRPKREGSRRPGFKRTMRRR